MNTTNHINIIIKGNGLSFEREIDENTASQVIALCLSTSKRQTETGTTSPFSTNVKDDSLIEYINRYSPKRNPDKILTFAGFLYVSRQQQYFRTKDIKHLFRDAREPAPANFNRDFNWVISNGWITEVFGKKGYFQITNSGLKVLKENFPHEEVKKSKGKHDGRRKKSKSAKQ